MDNTTFRFIIAGGGIHGTYLANTLLCRGLATHRELLVIDPHSEPLSNWKHVTSNVGMDFLRSPKVHHLDYEPFSLKHFSKKVYGEKRLFIPPNDRPSLRLFNSHAEWLLEKNRIRSSFLQGMVEKIDFRNGHSVVHTDRHVLKSKYVILALGQGADTNWPDWALAAKKRGGALSHVLDRPYSPQNIPENGTVAVIGGGMSAAHTAISLAGKNRKILLISPHHLKVHNYDADPGWMGPKYLTSFHKIPTSKERRSVITSARNTGTMTVELRKKLLLLEKKQQCSVFIDSVEECIPVSSSLMLVRLSSGDLININHAVLATGYRKQMPGARLVDRLADEYGLSCSDCGYPVPDTYLRWHKHLFVAGALAELEVGPASRNIIGVRLAAEKMGSWLNLALTK